MAKNSNNKIAMLTNFVLIIALLLIVSMVESRIIGSIKGNKSIGPLCAKVYGVVSGDTCFAVTQAFNLTTVFFDSMNPNLQCDSLFAGQWLCVAGIP